MELTTFAIPSFRKETVAKRLEKLARKAVKYGNADISYSFGTPYIVEVKTDQGNRKIEYVPITVEGDAPQIGGWKLLARVELMEGENLIHGLPGNDIEMSGDFRLHNGHCDHCNSLRVRNDVYVMSDGEKQIAVGRTCLRDFLGIDDPKSLVQRAQFFEELRNIEEEDFGDFSGEGVFSLKDVLENSAASIRKNGYVSKAKQAETGEETTGDVVANSLNGFKGYDIEVNVADMMWATATFDFFSSSENFGNDYMDNIRVLMKQDIVLPKHIALVASSVITAQRELAKKERIENAPKSSFIGEVKERLRDIELTISKIVYLGSGAFGPSFLHLMEDAGGNVFSWITGNKIEEAEGAKVKLDATVKDHKVYNGVNQTVLTRAKVK
jgi:hypothetical protein